MILFFNDLRYYPDAIIHRTTKNISFLRLAEVYKSQGNRNYYFHCILTDPTLEFVDPHAENLDIFTIGKITKECVVNPWYFFRECLRVPPQGSSSPGMFRANRGNIALIWAFLNHIDPALIQPRQTGKSLTVDGLMSYMLYVASENARVNMLTKDNELRVANVERLKLMRMYLPEYLRLTSKKDSDNSIEIVCSIKNNVYRTAVSQNSESAALNVARGLTAPLAHIDEGPFITFIDISLPAMLSAGNAARAEAKAAGYPYGSIFTTTAGKKDTRAGKYMYELIHGAMVWSEKLFDCADATELYKIVRANSRKGKLMVNITMSHRQLGITDEQLREMMIETNSFGEAAERDYLNKWTSGGLSSPLSVEINEKIRKSQTEPHHLEISQDGYILKWYIPEHTIKDYMANKPTVLAMDMSEALGGDNDGISMVLVDASNLQVIAAANINQSNLFAVSEYITSLMIKYQRMILVPERRSVGQSLIDTLLIKLPIKGIDPFKRIYNVIVDEKAVRVDDFNLINGDLSRRPTNFYDRHKRDFGFVTSGSGAHSRDKLYVDALNTAARFGCDKVHDKELIDQITSLEVRNGRIDHKEKGHDDMVIAWLLATWFLTASKNLNFYGIDAPLLHAEDATKPTARKNRTPYEEYEHKLQESIKNEIEKLLEDIKNVQDEHLLFKIEHRIKILDSRLKSEYASANTIDALIKDALEKRAKILQERARNKRNFNRPNSMDRYTNIVYN